MGGEADVENGNSALRPLSHAFPIAKNGPEPKFFPVKNNN